MTQQDLGLNLSTRRTRKAVFLDEMNLVVPWTELLSLIAPHAPRAKTGRPPFELVTMLRIHFLQQWFGLSDLAMEEALFETTLYREFAGLSSVERIPDRVSILRFRHLLEEHQLAPQILAVVNATLADKGLMLKQGTVVDATLIAAPSSTKNQDGERDPEMHQTKKGKQWYFGMKIHVGADVDSGAVHTVEVTAANEADITVLPKLLRPEDEVIFADAGYASDEYKRGSRKLGLRWCVQDKRKPGHELSSSQKKRNRKQSSIRARVEHVFRVIKRQFGFTKTRYRGLAKNTAQVNMLVGLANLYMLRGRLGTL